MQQPGIEILLPLLAIMLLGYGCGLFRLLPDASSEVFSRFVFLIAMPVFIFDSLADISLDEFFNWSFLAVLGGGMLMVFVISFIVSKYIFANSLAAQSVHALTTMFSSTAYIGLPLILLIFGEPGLVPAVVGAVITVAIFMPTVIFIVELDKGLSSEKAIRSALLTACRNPLLLATAAGLLLSASNYQMPAPVQSFLSLLGSMFIPSALFAVGLFISSCSIRGKTTEISWLVFAKLVVHPCITWWLAFHVFEIEPMLASIAVIQAALPAGVPVFVLARHYSVFEVQASAAIAVSTVAGVFSISAVLFWLL